MPDCNTQVDLFFGDKKDIIEAITENGPRYGDKKLGSESGLGGRSKGPSRAGTTAAARPARARTSSTVSQCDGTVAVKLSNDGTISKYAVEFTVKAGTFTKTARSPTARARRSSSRPAPVRSRSAPRA